MGESKKYYWLKLKTDFFNQREIKKLRKIAGGDTFTIIYLKMQLLSIKNEGVITFEQTENHLDEQLALELDEELENVRLTLLFLQNNALIEPISDFDYMMPRVVESIGSESDSAERVRRFREKDKLVALHCNGDVTESNTEVTKCNTEIEIELEKKERKKKENIYLAEIVEYLNIKTGKSFRCSSDKTKSCLNARWNEGFTELQDYKTVIDKKTKDWLNNKDMEKFLRPETLFGTKFESYVNENVKNMVSQQDLVWAE